jgi:nitrate reductase NapE component
MGALAVANILLGTVGFVISGCLAKTRRFQHLWVVVLFVWLTSLVNAFFGAFGFTQWLLSILLIIPMMLAGGGISFLFVRGQTSKLG